MLVQPLPENAHVGPVEADGAADVPEDVEITGAARLKIAIGRNAAEVSGHILDKDGASLENTLAAVGNRATGETRQGRRVRHRFAHRGSGRARACRCATGTSPVKQQQFGAMTDAEGKFSIKGLPLRSTEMESRVIPAIVELQVGAGSPRLEPPRGAN